MGELERAYVNISSKLFRKDPVRACVSLFNQVHHFLFLDFFYTELFLEISPDKNRQSTMTFIFRKRPISECVVAFLV